MLNEKISITSTISFAISSHIGISQMTVMLILKIIINFSICLLLPNILNIIIFYKTEEFKDLYGSAKSFLFRKQK